MKLYMGKVFRGQRIASVIVLRGVVMGKLSDGRSFILADRDLTRATFKDVVPVAQAA